MLAIKECHWFNVVQALRNEVCSNLCNSMMHLGCGSCVSSPDVPSPCDHMWHFLRHKGTK